MNTWIPLTKHDDYEITAPNSDGEWQIRKKRTDNQYKTVNQNLNKRLGYLYVKLEKLMPLHRVICEQFIPNPDSLPVCDHLNRNKQDNRVENLRWTTQSINWCAVSGEDQHDNPRIREKLHRLGRKSTDMTVEK
jgi:hypothetical protein